MLSFHWCCVVHPVLVTDRRRKIAETWLRKGKNCCKQHQGFWRFAVIAVILQCIARLQLIHAGKVSFYWPGKCTYCCWQKMIPCSLGRLKFLHVPAEPGHRDWLLRLWQKETATALFALCWALGCYAGKHGEHISAICPVASPRFYALKHQISVCVGIWLFTVPQEQWFCSHDNWKLVWD